MRPFSATLMTGVAAFILSIVLGEPVSASPAFRLTSPVFTQGGSIPELYTCDGPGISPPMDWTAPPQGTRSLALVVTDPDAPDPRAPRMTWVHWIIFDLPPSAGALQEDIKDLPEGAHEGLNSWKRLDYGGPCPPIGRHRYFFSLYALNTVLSFAKPPDRKTLLAAMQEHVLAETVLMGTYQRESH